MPSTVRFIESGDAWALTSERVFRRRRLLLFFRKTTWLKRLGGANA